MKLSLKIDYLLLSTHTITMTTARAKITTNIIKVVGNQESVVVVVVVVVVVAVISDTVICCEVWPETLHFAVALKISPFEAGTLNVSDMPDALL